MTGYFMACRTEKESKNIYMLEFYLCPSANT